MSATQITSTQCVVCTTPVTTAANTPLCSNSCKFEWVQTEVNQMSDDEAYCPICKRDCASVKRVCHHINTSKGLHSEHTVHRTKTCTVCSDEFIPTDIANTNKYCSRECYIDDVGGSDDIRKTPEYYEWAAAVHNSRDDCAECGATENLQAHHIVPISEDKSLATDLDNSQLLCGRCHSDKHPDIPDGLFYDGDSYLSAES